jgi:hypothetical protein
MLPSHAVVHDMRAVDIAKGMRLAARMLVKVDEGWTDQHIKAAFSLFLTKNTLGTNGIREK